jgi:Uncharacterised nucleotidyltransferase
MGDPQHTVEAASESTTALLWEACRREPDLAAIGAAAAGDVQPTFLVRLALVNRIGPLLWSALVKAGCETVLADQRPQFEELAELSRLHAVLLEPHVVSLAVAPLTAAGLEPVVMKGPAVARRYPAPGLRPMDDLDLLLPPEQHADALAALTRSDWTISRPRKRDLYDTQLRHPHVPSMPLELHYGLEGWHERSNRLDPVRLWQLRVPFDCLGTPAYTLPLAEEIVALAAHAGKPYHGFDRLIWLADLAMLIGHAQEHGGFDWDAVEEVARRTECMTVVSTALRMATRMGLDVPDGRFELPTSGWRAAPLHRLLKADWPVAQGRGTFHIRFALVDSPWRRLVLLGASPYRLSWGERLMWPATAAARSVEVLRHTRRAATGATRETR